MDPTDLVCKISDSFTNEIISFDETILPPWFSTNPITLSSDITISSLHEKPNLPILYGNEERYELLQTLKDNFKLLDHDGIFSKARDISNPYEKLGNSIFMNRAAIKLANIDAIYHFTGHLTGYVDYYTDNRFSFCDIASGPGGFTEYLQFRLPNSEGFGMTLTGKCDFNLRALDLGRFFITYGNDGTGNLYTNWEYFINWVLERETGVDLTLADGGFDVEDGFYRQQEYLSSRLLLIQAIIGIACTKNGGNFLLKTFDTVTSISAQIIFVLSCCFEKIAFFKPVSSRPANAEKYLICWGKRPREVVNPYLFLLKETTKNYNFVQSGIDRNNIYVTNFLHEKLPDDFIIWLLSENNRHIEKQIHASQKIINYMQSGSPPSSADLINLHKCLIIWNIPDNK